ncbi:MAG: ABC transporter ATP-binding protein, partial [Lachnospiraceae bacterium]|nr:ABC transporter ATP-binding protein [Lachnospiraceae bacterium]
VESGRMDVIFTVGLAMLGAAAVGLYAGIMGGKYGAKASAGFAKNLRQAMFSKIQTFSFANIDKFSSASLITRLTTDVTNLQNSYQMILRIGARAPSSLIVAMIVSFTISPELAQIYLWAALILGVVISIIVTLTKRIFDQVFKKYDELNASVEENVSGIRVVKAYVREAFETEKFHTASHNVYKMFIKAERILVGMMPTAMAMIYACILLISWNGAKMIVGNRLTTGELVSMLAYCMNILMSLMMLSMIFVMVTMSIASAQRIVEVLEEEPTITNPKAPIFEVSDGSIDFLHVDFAYNAKSIEYAMTDVTLHIESGETIGVIGGTGSSKSTLVSLISRLYDVKNGMVRVGGIDVRKYDLDTLRNEVSVVLQNNVLFSGSILDNLRWGDPEATDEECMEACRLACADEFIERLPDGYDTYIEQGGTNVSGGQRQRLCIARALLKKPKVLILDDSTSAVDTATDAKIRKAFRETIPGTTKLIIAQRISSVQDADRIVVLDEGKVNGIGTHEELLETNAIYRDVYESQTGGGTADFDEGKEHEKGLEAMKIRKEKEPAAKGGERHA